MEIYVVSVLFPLFVSCLEFHSEGNLSQFLVYDPFIFVGGTDVLLQFDFNLKLLQSVSTGPRLDSSSCHLSECHDFDKVITHNVNKILVLDSEDSILIYCGSLFQGSCWKFTTHNISQPSEFISEAVAANDETSSTFAFIAPQSYHPWSRKNVLYVGTTFTGKGDYRHDVPAISSRNLNDLKFAEDSFSKQSLLRIDVKYRDRFLVSYIYGFNSSSHIYFLTLQKKSHIAGKYEKDEYISRISRICMTDANYETYTEITLECSLDGHKFSKLTTAFFTSSSPFFSRSMGYTEKDSVLFGVFVHGNDSALCAYSLPSLEIQFEENVHKCFNGSMIHRNLEYISGPIQDGKCPEIGKSGNIKDFCQVALKISGSSPIVSEPLHIFPSQLLSSFHVTEKVQTDGGRVGILTTGSDSGVISIYSLFSLLDHWTPRVIFKSLDVSPILQVSLIGDTILALQRQSLRTFNASECESSSSCSECLGSGVNPFCGWCSLYNICTLQTHCSKSLWLSSSSVNMCMRIEGIFPTALSVSTSSDISLTISHLLTLPVSESFICLFNDEITFPATRVSHNRLSCPSPLDRLSPKVSNVSLSIFVSSSLTKTPLFPSIEIFVYNCETQSSCRDCFGTHDCVWCLETHSCQSSLYDCISVGTRNDSICPRLSPIPKIPNDVPLALSLPFERNLPSVYHTEYKYWCLVSIENAKFKVAAILKERNVIVCEVTEYNYMESRSETEASLSVLVNENDVLDSSKLIIYKCSIIGSDCSLCKNSDGSYGCIWCNSRCSSSCSPPSPNNNSSELRHTCPKPFISSIVPSSGPFKGGTLVSVTGSNLAVKRSDAEGQIFLGTVPCSLIDFQVSTSLLCRNGEENKLSNDKSHTVSLYYNGVPLGSFTYADYSISRVSPSRGPLAGGTEVTISGVNLHIGGSVSVFLDRSPCSVTQRNSSTLKCLTSSSTRQMNTKWLHVLIDDDKRSYRHRFVYTHNPIIHEIKPTSSFFSGGRTLTIHGDFFNVIQHPEMILLTGDKNKEFVTSCRILSSRIMECETPSLSSLLHSKTSHKDDDHEEEEEEPAAASTGGPLLLDVGFKMDNVTELRTLSKSYPHLTSKIHFYEDPKYYPFGNGLKIYKGDELVLEGSKLNLASSSQDVIVSIGNEAHCNVTSLTESQLICFPPPSNGEFSNLPVVVKVGKTLEFQLGEIVYDSYSSEIPTEIFGAVSAAVVLFVFLAVSACVLFKHRSSTAEREYKRIQIQMECLENNVRSECKEAFAELQTDMTDLNMELESSGIPLLEHRKYMMLVFFPGVYDHPILTPSSSSSSSKFSPMSQFSSLLFNKGFLLTLIETLEKQSNFSLKDRINFASLLTVVTFTNMEYLTDVVKTLLLKLIDKTVNGRHPEYMLRRNESIVDKLLHNWLSLSLYGYLSNIAGSSFFLLIQAIRVQIEKGPVDALTQESKYSLSENNLLKDSISYSVIHLLLRQRDLDQPLSVKVLSVDSISQVKAKILSALYKNIPFSLRPSVHDIDLEWQCGAEASVILQDLDLTSKESSAGKHINTLSHYGICSSAFVSLVPKSKVVYESHSSSYSSSSSTSYSSQSHHFSSVGGPLLHLKGTGKTNRSESSSSFKSIPEIFLTRLLSTKGTLQKFIHDFFSTVLSINSQFPPVIKWLYDIFDEAALTHGLSSPEILHSWKANSVLLRFWVSLIKNPDVIFDLDKTPSTYSNLSLLAQIFMDSCSYSEPRLSKDSSSISLLFAKDTREYRDLVKNSFDLIRNMDPVTDENLRSITSHLSRSHEGKFNQIAACKEIFMYVTQYYADFHAALHENKMIRTLELVPSLENILKSYSC